MNILQAVILGLVQGLGEFLPISSSGHLQFATMMLGLDSNPDAYMLLTILLHFGTLIPLVIVFWDEWWSMLRHPIKQKSLWLMLIAASLPALAVHVLGFDEIFETGWFLGCCFLVTSVLLLITEYVSTHRPGKAQVGWLNVLVMGCFQAFAILPGISRSGSTITGGVVSGLDRKASSRFSFMMCAPAIAGSFLLEGLHAVKDGTLAAFSPVPMIVGIAVAALAGFFAIRFMLKLINRISFNWFALYMALLGLTFLVLQLTGNPLLPAFAPGAVPLGM